MGFLRRFFGGGRETDRDGDGPADDLEDASTPAELDDEERAHELELARFEQDRTDELMRRQQRYADRSWTPPTQGGERRAEDGDAGRP